MLKERFRKQIEVSRVKQSTLKKRHETASEISPADQDRFYSSWIYGALHVLASLPQNKTEKDLADSLGLSLKRVTEALQLLERTGLVVRSRRGFEIGPHHIHLGSDSHFIQRHHTIQSLGDRNPADLHYSGAISLSKHAASTVRDNLLRSFEENMKIVREDAKEEVAYVYNFDFYELGHY